MFILWLDSFDMHIEKCNKKNFFIGGGGKVHIGLGTGFCFMVSLTYKCP